jgi:hypothetical protein
MGQGEVFSVRGRCGSRALTRYEMYALPVEQRRPDGVKSTCQGYVVPDVDQVARDHHRAGVSRRVRRRREACLVFLPSAAPAPVTHTRMP